MEQKGKQSNNTSLAACEQDERRKEGRESFDLLRSHRMSWHATFIPNHCLWRGALRDNLYNAGEDQRLHYLTREQNLHDWIQHGVTKCSFDHSIRRLKKTFFTRGFSSSAVTISVTWSRALLAWSWPAAPVTRSWPRPSSSVSFFSRLAFVVILVAEMMFTPRRPGIKLTDRQTT